MSDPRRDIPDQIKRHFFRKAVEARGLLGLGPGFVTDPPRCGELRGQDLNGTKPADVPVAQLTEYDLVINLKTKTLGLTIPPSLLLRADQVIE